MKYQLSYSVQTGFLEVFVTVLWGQRYFGGKLCEALAWGVGESRQFHNSSSLPSVSLLPSLSFFLSHLSVPLFFLHEFSFPVLSLAGPPAPLGHWAVGWGSEYQPKETWRKQEGTCICQNPWPTWLPSLLLSGLLGWMSAASSWLPCWSACASSLPTATWHLRKSPEMKGTWRTTLPWTCWISLQSLSWVSCLACGPASGLWPVRRGCRGSNTPQADIRIHCHRSELLYAHSSEQFWRNQVPLNSFG